MVWKVSTAERQSSETSNIRIHIFFFKIFSAFLFYKKNTVYSERVTKPAERACQTAKSLLKENGGLRSNNDNQQLLHAIKYCVVSIKYRIL